MAGLKEIKRRLDSVKNTKKITYAMKLVAAAKLKKAQESVQRSRAYSTALQNLLLNLSAEIDLSEIKHPLINSSENKRMQKIGLLVIGGSRGLCGAYNSNINRKVENFFQEQKKLNRTITSIVLCKKPAEYYRQSKKQYEASYENLPEDATLWEVEDICKIMEKKIVSAELDAVYVIYTKFKSAISMNVMVEKILPIESENLTSTQPAYSKQSSGVVLFEPSAEEVFSQLIPRIIRSRVRQACLDSKASEYGSRMTAMEAATKNAGELIHKLQLTYNKIRQSRITSELLDILGGAEAIK
mgnify:CR=1 FL=1